MLLSHIIRTPCFLAPSPKGWRPVPGVKCVQVKWQSFSEGLTNPTTNWNDHHMIWVTCTKRLYYWYLFINIPSLISRQKKIISFPRFGGIPWLLIIPVALGIGLALLIQARGSCELIRFPGSWWFLWNFVESNDFQVLPKGSLTILVLFYMQIVWLVGLSCHAFLLEQLWTTVKYFLSNKYLSICFQFSEQGGPWKIGWASNCLT